MSRRVPEDYMPRDERAEEAIIGSVLKKPTCIADIIDLPVDDFHVPKYRAIWAAMRFLWEHGLPIDYTTTVDAHHQHMGDGRSDVFTFQDLAEINIAVPTAANVEHYARIVRSKASLKRMAQIGSRMFQGAVRDGAQPTDILAQARSDIDGIVTERNVRLSSPEQWIHAGLDDFEARRDGKRVAVTTGLENVDRLMGGGMESGGLYLLMGVTGLGKTELAFQWALHVSKTHGPVVFASLEMGLEELFHRAMRILGQLPRNKMVDGKLDDQQADTVVRIGNELSIGNLWPVTPTDAYTVGDLRADAMRVQSHTGRVRLIVLDYVQRLGDRAGRNSNREQDVALMVERLKWLAREMRCPVLALVQPNREYATRGDKAPRLSDLRESGRLEIEADVVLGMFRDELFDPQSKRHGLADVYLLKNRSGAGGALNSKATLEWANTRYVNYAPTQPEVEDVD